MANLKNKHVVIGLGKTGLSCVRFLKRLECDVVVIDTRDAPPGQAELAADFPDVMLHRGELSQFNLSQAHELIVSPGIAIKTPAIAKAMAAGVPVAGDIELFARSVDAPVIAVTGSNGKSTVVTLIGDALQAAGHHVCVAGNIGVPVLDALSDATRVDVWVLELSSFQLETTHSLRPAVAVNLNVTEDHMDRYDGLDEYAMAKQRIFEGCGAAVYWLEDRRTKPIQAVKTLLPFGGGEQTHGRFWVNTQEAESTLMDGSRPLLASSDVNMKGDHNLLNMAACLAAVAEFNRTVPAESVEALKVFPGLPHRCQWVANVNGADWFNDSKGTNVGSTIAAIQGLRSGVAGRLFLIAGGDAKGADFSELQPAVEASVSEVVVYGRDAQKIANALSGVVSLTQMETMHEAVAQLKGVVQPGDAVLFSPACASFDQFKHYEDRGDQFKAAVMEG